MEANAELHAVPLLSLGIHPPVIYRTASWLDYRPNVDDTATAAVTPRLPRSLRSQYTHARTWADDLFHANV
jgi:hypothetical protein